MGGPSSIREMEWERPLVEPRRDAEIEQWARQQGGNLYPLRFFAACPWFARGMVRLSALELAHLDYDLANVTVLVVSQDNSCRFCYAGARLLLRVTGMSDAEIDGLEGDLVSAELEPKRRLGLEFARRLSRSNPPPSAADVQALREAGFSREELLELAFVTAQYVIINRATTLLALPPERVERMDRGWIVRLLRPLLSRSLKKRWVRRRPVFLSAEQKRGPFASVVEGLDGLPGAPTLRGILDEAWSSPLLTTRARSLAFAVVARGLGGERVEREALALLAGEGFDRSAAEQVLSHLASPALDRVESALLPFVRETIWYEPGPLQRRTRALRDLLSEEELLEAIGIASFANGVCRLSLAVDAIG
jgi:alkylhydroperoxidase family enzyme